MTLKITNLTFEMASFRHLHRRLLSYQISKARRELVKGQGQ